MPRKKDSLSKALMDESITPGAYIDDEVVERSYIGGSVIGNECFRSITLRLRGFPVDNLTPAKKRIFDTGHRMEDQIVKMLIDVFTKWNGGKFELIKTGAINNQLELRYGYHVKTYVDGCIRKISDRGTNQITGLMEAKSANHSSFLSVKRLGVRLAHPEYYDQVQLMMGVSDIHNTIFVMVDKDSSQIYAEGIPFHEETFDYLKAKIEIILNKGDDKIASKPTDWRCDMCSYKQVCWFNHPVKKEQRTCRHCIHGNLPEKRNAFAWCDNARVKINSISHSLSIKAKRDIAGSCENFKDYRTKDD